MFQHPFTCLISGPTQSGKTYFVLELLRNLDKMFLPVPTKVIWCHGESQEKHKELPSNVILSEGLEGLKEIDPKVKNLLILDDLMHETGSSDEVAELFTKGSHHRNLSVIMIVQNIFHKSKIIRTVSLNSHYIILFKNPRDAGQIQTLAQQLFPGKTKYLIDAYKQATSRPHGYLVLDLTQSTLEKHRVLSNILPGEEGFYYIPK